MTGTNRIEAAYRRRQMLCSILIWTRRQAIANPADKRWAAIGLASAFESKAETQQELNASFDELFALVEHLAILDMASSFEVASQRRLGTRVGEARSVLANRARKGQSADVLGYLVRQTESFGSMKAVEDFCRFFIDKAVIDELALVREARNNFAHGTDILSAPVIDVERARTNLNKVLDSI